MHPTLRWPVLVLMLATLACQTASGLLPTPPATTAPPAVTASPPAPLGGLSRHDPLPAAPQTDLPGWRIEILDWQQGDAAWNTLQAINQFNTPPPPGYEYLLLHMRLTHTSGDPTGVTNFVFAVTGEHNTLYRPVSAVTEQRFESVTLAPGEAQSGWVSFLTRAGEAQRLLVFDLVVDDTPTYFISLDAGARIPLSADLYEILPDRLGETADEPVPLGQTATLDHWEITVLETQSGETAWQTLQTTSSNNAPPPPGQQYWLAYVRVRLIDQRTQPTRVDVTAWRLASPEGAVFEATSVILPKPRLEAHLFPGGTTEGWWGGLAPTRAPVVAQFREFLAPQDPLNVRFFALEK